MAPVSTPWIKQYILDVLEQPEDEENLTKTKPKGKPKKGINKFKSVYVESIDESNFSLTISDSQTLITAFLTDDAKTDLDFASLKNVCIRMESFHLTTTAHCIENINSSSHDNLFPIEGRPKPPKFSFPFSFLISKLSLTSVIAFDVTCNPILVDYIPEIKEIWMRKNPDERFQFIVKQIIKKEFPKENQIPARSGKFVTPLLFGKDNPLLLEHTFLSGDDLEFYNSLKNVDTIRNSNNSGTQTNVFDGSSRNNKVLEFTQIEGFDNFNEKDNSNDGNIPKTQIEDNVNDIFKTGDFSNLRVDMNSSINIPSTQIDDGKDYESPQKKAVQETQIHAKNSANSNKSKSVIGLIFESSLKSISSFITGRPSETKVDESVTSNPQNKKENEIAVLSQSPLQKDKIDFALNDFGVEKNAKTIKLQKEDEVEDNLESKDNNMDEKDNASVVKSIAGKRSESKNKDGDENENRSLHSKKKVKKVDSTSAEFVSKKENEVSPVKVLMITHTPNKSVANSKNSKSLKSIKSPPLKVIQKTSSPLLSENKSPSVPKHIISANQFSQLSQLSQASPDSKSKNSKNSKISKKRSEREEAVNASIANELSGVDVRASASLEKEGVVLVGGAKRSPLLTAENTQLTFSPPPAHTHVNKQRRFSLNRRCEAEDEFPLIRVVRDQAGNKREERLGRGDRLFFGNCAKKISPANPCACYICLFFR